MLEMTLRRRNVDRDLVRKLHATSVKDFAIALRDDDYEIVQFSGHGSEAGIYLEKDTIDGGGIVNASHVAALLREALPDLRAAIFVSCFSNAFAKELLDVASYTITLDGTTDDDVAIEFISAFYDCYFQFNSIENAFRNACVSIDALGKGDLIKPLLYRRAKEKNKKGVELQVLFDRREDSVYIDLSEAEDDITSLDIPQNQFLSLLSRKIRVHKWVFKIPREKALLQIGRYFGEFSWKDPSDVIVCHKIMKISPAVDDKVYELWTDMIVAYNDLACQRYRILLQPASPENENLLKRALDEHYRCHQKFFETTASSAVLRSTVADQFRASKAFIASNLSQADVMLGRGDLQMTLASIEASLSSMHDLVDSLTGFITKVTK